VLDPEQLYTRVQRFLGARGVHDEDMEQEMVLVCLEREGDPTHLEWVYQRALDRVHPRHHVAGRRVRPSLETPYRYSLDGNQDGLFPYDTAQLLPYHHGAFHALPPDDPCAVLDGLRQPGELRAKLILRLVYGYTEAELAWLWGVTESRISQQIGGLKAPVLLGEAPHVDLVTTGLAWEVDWIVMSDED
jgi:hypothetical protein